ncbi:MAG: alpha-galactosidase, partial [Phycisphaeraceae bacterium]|nr:alpha-galactosidase [Phycisphaeraceae bacterium]
MNQKIQISKISEKMEDRDGSSSVKSHEMELIRNWISQIIGSNTQDSGSSCTSPERHFEGVPFSFQCGMRSSRQWLKLEDTKIESSEWADGKKNYFLRWTDQETSVSCEMELTEFQDFPVIEWVVRLRNDGVCVSEQISDFKALDVFWKSSKEDEVPELRRSLGSDGRHDDFQYLCDELRESAWRIPRTIRMDSANNNDFRKVRDGSPPWLLDDGRTSATWLPFFNLKTGKDGIIGALGWSGQWFAEFAHDGVGKTDISAGMEHLELKLQPGEEIRSPRVMLLYWHGEPIHGHNVLRKFILEFHSPQVDGKPVEMPICNGAWGGTPTPKHLEIIDAIATNNLPYDYYWVDAGWYGTSEEPCPNVFKFTWAIVGDWRVNKQYHPNGLKPIRDAVNKTGMKFLLWLEIEKALHGTPITLEHPEWFLSKTKEEPKANDELLLNLGNPEAWQWVVETLSKLIEDNGMDCYRVDFNMDPSPYWRNAEEDGRKGIVEMRFVEGLYAFWDELRRRHPGLLIDNCASGGRRLDLETIGRSVALWRTDYTSSLNADALQSQSTGLNLWLPLNSTTPGAKTGDTYQFRSALSAGL